MDGLAAPHQRQADACTEQAVAAEEEVRILEAQVRVTDEALAEVGEQIAEASVAPPDEDVPAKMARLARGVQLAGLVDRLQAERVEATARLAARSEQAAAHRRQAGTHQAQADGLRRAGRDPSDAGHPQYNPAAASPTPRHYPAQPVPALEHLGGGRVGVNIPRRPR
jgi:hypothetical protein